MELIKVILPIIVIQMLFAAAAIVHIVKNKKTRIFSWEIWIFVVILVNFIGPLLYFTIGREED